MPRAVRIGNASGYWGDDPFALRRQVLGAAPPEYVVADFLAELTMSILVAQRARDPSAGYARDFVTQAAPLLGPIRERGMTVITNAGGVNPEGCARSLLAEARKEERPLRVAVVDGDDLAPRLEDVRDHLVNAGTGAPLPDGHGEVLSANAYIGAEPVVRALRHRPDFVITGRVADASLALAAARRALDWSASDFRWLGRGIAAGHVLECGAQATGGNFTDWRRVPGLGNLGFPIVELSEDGSFIVTKQPGTGGLVSPPVVREQLVYEVEDPARYASPDATADFSGLRVSSDGPDRARVEGGEGHPPPPDYKVSAAVRDGFALRGSLVVGGPDALAKSLALDAAIRDRLRIECRNARLAEPEEIRVELAGSDAAQRNLSDRAKWDPSEGIVRFAAWSRERAPLELLRKLIPALILGGPSGVAADGGAPRISPVARFWPGKIPRRFVTARVRVLDAVPGSDGAPRLVHEEEVSPDAGLPTMPLDAPRDAAGAGIPDPGHPTGSATVRAPLGAIAHARSGDKGDSANIGVIGRSPECWSWMREHLTESVVSGWLSGMAASVTRYEAPGLHALNFVLGGVLGGGGTRSLFADPQGKTLASGLLRQEMEIPRALLPTIPEADRPASPQFQHVVSAGESETSGKPAFGRPRGE